MQAHPKVGHSYRQEYYKGEAEDMAKVLGLNESVTVPYGSFDHVLVTKEWRPLASRPPSSRRAHRDERSNGSRTAATRGPIRRGPRRLRIDPAPTFFREVRKKGCARFRGWLSLHP
jgi:hypothetical protein